MCFIHNKQFEDGGTGKHASPPENISFGSNFMANANDNGVNQCLCCFTA